MFSDACLYITNDSYHPATSYNNFTMNFLGFFMLNQGPKHNTNIQLLSSYLRFWRSAPHQIFFLLIFSAKYYRSLSPSSHRFMLPNGKNSFRRRTWDLHLHFNHVLFTVQPWRFFKLILLGDKMNVSLL